MFVIRFYLLGGRGCRAESVRPIALVSVKRRGKGSRRRKAWLRKNHVRKLCKNVATCKRALTTVNHAGSKKTSCPQAMRNKCLLFGQPCLSHSFIQPKLIKTELVEEIIKIISMRGKRDGCP